MEVRGQFLWSHFSPSTVGSRDGIWIGSCAKMLLPRAIPRLSNSLLQIEAREQSGFDLNPVSPAFERDNSFISVFFFPPSLSSLLSILSFLLSFSLPLSFFLSVFLNYWLLNSRFTHAKQKFGHISDIPQIFLFFLNYVYVCAGVCVSAGVDGG